MTTAAGAHHQQPVLHYPASMFTSLVDVCRRSPAAPAGKPTQIVRHNPIGAIVVAFNLIANPARGKPRGTASTSATEHDD